MPDINDLGLPPEEVGSIDYNAPEPGSFPPQLNPGNYRFVFHLEEDPWDTVLIEGRKYMQVVHKATTTLQGAAANNGMGGEQEIELRFQRVNFYKHPAMANSSAGDLIRALNLQVTGGLTPQAVASLFQSVDGRASYDAEVGWRVYCKDDEIEVSTHARKKKIKAGEQVPWPKGADGKLLEQATCPKCKRRMFGNAEIMRYKLPGAEASPPPPSYQQQGTAAD